MVSSTLTLADCCVLCRESRDHVEGPVVGGPVAFFAFDAGLGFASLIVGPWNLRGGGMSGPGRSPLSSEDQVTADAACRFGGKSGLVAG